ncbi:hypothetical protein EG827_07715 [bacterium]|nr:hypothetical protein [bacterium]
MERKGLNHAKNDQQRIMTIVTLVLLILSFLWIFYDLYVYRDMKSDSSAIGSHDNGIGIGFIFRIMLYIPFALMLLRAFKGGLKSGILVIIAIITGVVSAISVVFDWAALVDIYHDYPDGLSCTTEWAWLSGSLVIQLAFCITGILLIFNIMKLKRTINTAARPVVDEIVFEITQYIGIVCGFAGLVFTAYANIALDDWEPGNWLIRLILFYSMVIILPYFVLIVYWLVRLARKGDRTLYDEKQKQDLALSGLSAWLVSIPVMVVIFLFNCGNEDSATGFLWLPYYLFSTLFIFSVSLLKRFKKG